MISIRPSLFYDEDDYSIFDAMDDHGFEFPDSVRTDLQNGADLFPPVMTSIRDQGAIFTSVLTPIEKADYFADHGIIVTDRQRNLVDDSDVSDSIKDICSDLASARFLHMVKACGYTFPKINSRKFDLGYLLEKLGYDYSECYTAFFSFAHVTFYLNFGSRDSRLLTDVWEFLDSMWCEEFVPVDEVLCNYLQSSAQESVSLSFFEDFVDADDPLSTLLTSVVIPIVGAPAIFEIDYPCSNNFRVSDLLDHVLDNFDIKCSLWYHHKATGFRFHPDMDVNILNGRLVLYVNELEPDILSRYPKFSSSSELLHCCYWENDYVFILPRRYQRIADSFYTEARYHCVAYISKYIDASGKPSITRHGPRDMSALKVRSGDRSLSHKDWMTENYANRHSSDLTVDFRRFWSDSFGLWVPIGQFFICKLPGVYTLNGARTIPGSVAMIMIGKNKIYSVMCRRKHHLIPATLDLYHFLRVVYSPFCYPYLCPEITIPKNLHGHLINYKTYS